MKSSFLNAWGLVLWLGSCLFVSASTGATNRRHLRRRALQQSDFVEQCSAALLSDDAIQDDLISQDDFADFLSNYCIQANLCDAGTEIDFTELSMELQLAFVLFICDQPQESERELCLDSLTDVGEEFGYDVNDETNVEQEVEKLCSQAYIYAAQMGLLPSTGAPSPAPLPPDATASPSLPTDGTGTTTPTLPSEEDGGTPAPSPTALPAPTLVAGGTNVPMPTTNTSTLTPFPTKHDDIFSPPGVPPGNDGPSGSGGVPATDEGTSDQSGSTVGSSTVSALVIVGVSVAGAVIVVVAFLVFRRRRKRAVDHDDKGFVKFEVQGDESIFTEDSAQFKIVPKGLDLVVDTQSLPGLSRRSSFSESSAKSGGSDYTPKNIYAGAVNVRSVAQFDPSNAAAAIALGMSAAESSARAGLWTSDRNVPNAGGLLGAGTRDEKIQNLEEAVEHADWNEVAKLAGTLASSSDEEVSTLSEVSSGHASSRWSSRSSVKSEEARQAMQIDELVSRGDWSGVAAFAAQLSSAHSVGSASRDAAKPPPETNQSRSFLDFVTGRRAQTSAAATAAMVGAASRDVARHDELSESTHSVVGGYADAVASLPSVVEAGQTGTFETQSSSSHGSQDKRLRDDGEVAIPNVNEPTSSALVRQKSQRGWLGQIRSLRDSRRASSDSAPQDVEGAKKPVVDSTKVSLLAALNEAVVLSDWKAIEAISAKLVDVTHGDSTRRQGTSSHSAAESRAKDQVTPSAASLAVLKGSSTKRSVSRRIELDNAVEKGDWEEVERLITEILQLDQTSPKDEKYKVLSEGDKVTGSLLDIAQTPTPAKSPFQATPSSSVWSQSPVDAIRKLISIEDWKGVRALSGIFELEKNGTLPPTFASLSADSAESVTVAQDWIKDVATDTPSSEMEKDATARSHPSPSTSTSTGASGDIREVKRLVNAKNWKGLAAFAGAEQEHGFENEKLVGRNLFGTESNDLEDVKLRNTDGPMASEIKKKGSEESLHGTQVLIPFWQTRIDKASTTDDSSKVRDSSKDQK